LYERFVFPRLARRESVGTVFYLLNAAPPPGRLRAITTVYDLLLLERRNDYPWCKRLYLRWAFREVARRGARVVTISEFCRRDLHAKLGVDPARIAVASPGIDAEFLDGASAMAQLGLPSSYLLSVAGVYPHKRLPVLLDAFSAIASGWPDLHLVLAGTYVGRAQDEAVLRDRAAASGLGARIRFLPHLTRAALPPLFAGAAALVSSSEFEGFGIPVLEAMAVGCPVAAAPAEAVVEVLAGHGWVAKDFSAAALAEAIRGALQARAEAPGALERARARALTTYTWDRAAAAVEALIAESSAG
jgi:glycosyltransferase involved in cell wall biosynthesis